jgi:hypothetical protein
MRAKLENCRAVGNRRKRSGRGSRNVLSFIGAIAILTVGASVPAQNSSGSSASSSGKERSSIGFSASENVTPKDVGLPWYPGAKESKDKPDDSPAIQFGFWGGSTDFKLAVLKLQSTDSPEKVQAFYRNALARYGHVVTCTASSSTAKKDDGKSSDQLDCQSDDKPKPNETVLKAGTKSDQHLVGITPSGSGSIFQLVYVRTPKSDD